MADWYFRNQQSNLSACPACGKLVGRSEEFCPYCAKRLRSGSGWRGALRRLPTLFNRPDAATRFLLYLICAVFVLQVAADFMLPVEFRDPPNPNANPLDSMFEVMVGNRMTYLRMGSNQQVIVKVLGQYWRFVTACFLHFGLFHILFNGYALWILGRLTEKLWGARQVFAVFVLSGIAGSAVSYFWHWQFTQPVNSAGASGAISGLLGLILGAYYRERGQIGAYLGSQIIRWVVYLLAYGLVLGADNAGHIGGLLGGAVFGYFLPPTGFSRHRARDEKIWNAAALVSLALLLVSFGAAIVLFARGPGYMIALLGG